MATLRGVVFPDIHVPFHDEAFFKLILKTIKIVKPDFVVQLGDFVDWWQISRYDRNPARKNTAFEDLLEYSQMLDKIEATMKPGSRFYQIEGNHEDRLRRFTWSKCPELAQMIRPVPETLSFSDRNKEGRVKFQWYPMAKWNACMIGDVCLHHGHYFNEHVAVNNLKRYKTKLITGHTHRYQYASNGEIWSLSLGHGAKDELIQHVPVPSTHQQAFAILTVENGIGSVEPILVQDGSCNLRGEMVRA